LGRRRDRNDPGAMAFVPDKASRATWRASVMSLRAFSRSRHESGGQRRQRRGSRSMSSAAFRFALSGHAENGGMKRCQIHPVRCFRHELQGMPARRGGAIADQLKFSPASVVMDSFPCGQPERPRAYTLKVSTSTSLIPAWSAG
jgi:hypothetical protein